MTKIVGILNITPDSFSDGAKFDSLPSALDHVNKMLTEGVDVIDVGAESTRPQATPITHEEEWRRLAKILPETILVTKKFSHYHNKKIKISIDSYHFETIKKAWELGVDVINDVSGLIDEKIVEFIAAKNVATILMHNLQVPVIADVVINKNLNLCREILSWAQEKILHLAKKNIKKSQLIFDPGIGFGKDAFQSINILKNIDDFKVLDLPIYVGHSKKSFLEKINFSAFGENLSRGEKTLIISKYLLKKNVDFLRVHDFKEHVALT